MTYPVKILPHSAYKSISCDIANYYLGRYTNTNSLEELINKTTKQVKQEHICHPKEIGADLSTSLLGVFEPPFFKIELTEQGKAEYSFYCEPDIIVPIPKFNEDYIINAQRHFWVLLIGLIDNQMVDYTKSDLAFTALCKVCHTPMKWNYWHFSIRWLTDDGFWHELPENEKKKNWAKRLAHEARSFIAKFAKIEERDYDELNPEYYFKEINGDANGTIY